MDAPELVTKYTRFTVIRYGQGNRMRTSMEWFKTDVAVSWVEARDRLASAGVIDLTMAGRPSDPGGWMLSVDKTDYSEDRAEELP